jgi:TatA/E family protein of Tat protein translocase
MFDYLLMFESPVQWMIVLVIALIVFGPNRLPEIGRQLGAALRELRKAKDDMVRSFHMGSDLDPDPYPYHNSAATDYSTNSYDPPAIERPIDLTDYTIVGQPPADMAKAQAINGPDDTVPRSWSHNGGEPPSELSQNESTPIASVREGEKLA